MNLMLFSFGLFLSVRDIQFILYPLEKKLIHLCEWIESLEAR